MNALTLNNLVAPTMRKIAARALPIFSISLAVLLLSILLAVSTSKSGTAFRSIDLKAQYLHELATGLDQQLSAAVTYRSDNQAAIADIGARMQSTLVDIEAELTRIYQPNTLLDSFRLPAITAFNAIDPLGFDINDSKPTTMHFEALGGGVKRVTGQLESFNGYQASYAADYEYVARESRALTQVLRSTGRDELADKVFRTSKQIIEYVDSGEPPRLAQVGEILERLKTITDTLSTSERATATTLLETVPALVGARTSIAEATNRMNLSGFRDTLAGFRDQTTRSYVHTLSMINDARVLLNLYTVLLLVILAYFGWRLRNSYFALNRSHDDLELRVQERTADLENAYEELKESQVQLVQAEKMSSLGQLVAGVMHEINTPLMYVMNNSTVTTEIVGDLSGFIDATLPILDAQSPDEVKAAVNQLLNDREDYDPENLRECVQEVGSLGEDTIEGLNQISELVLSLKDFSRLDRAAQDRFNLREGIEKTLTITRNLLKYGVEVETHFDEVDDIFCSPSRINQIFINLVTNAVQAMDGKGKLSISVSQREDWVDVVFEDTGCGIPEENLNKIMDPFFTTKPVGQGTGLGLSIVRQIVEEHQGQILIDSKVGSGTRITVGLPVQRQEDEVAA